MWKTRNNNYHRKLRNHFREISLIFLLIVSQMIFHESNASSQHPEWIYRTRITMRLCRPLCKWRLEPTLPSLFSFFSELNFECSERMIDEKSKSKKNNPRNLNRNIRNRIVIDNRMEVYIAFELNSYKWFFVLSSFPQFIRSLAISFSFDSLASNMKN